MTETNDDISEAIRRLAATVKASKLPSPERRRAIREAAGLSPREVAAVLNVEAMTVMRWEQGALPRRDHATAYRELLDALAAVNQEATP